jgi:D-alanyl-D-alanine carboxypeptidase/D-alanyl-D-alanine-endopeptidase (penicillin-binding protein 4)
VIFGRRHFNLGDWSKRLAILFVLGLLPCTSLLAQRRSDIASQCKELIRKSKDFDVGFVALPMKGGDAIVSHDANALLIPASNQKLLTTSAAWLGPGKDHIIVTEVLAHGVITDGVLHGSLRLRGEGDATLKGERTPKELAQGVVQAGITHVMGDLLVDDRAFDDARIGPNWPKDELTLEYMAEVSALSLDFGMVKVVVTGVGDQGDAAFARVSPSDCGWTLESRLKTCSNAKDQVIHIARRDQDRVLVATGKVWTRTEAQPHSISISDSAMVFGSVLLQELIDAGIQIDGVLRRPSAEQNLLGGHRLTAKETPIEESLKEILKSSQNHCAEMLFKHLGYLEKGSGNFGAAGHAVRLHLEKAGIPLGKAVVADGSGLSRDDRVSATMLAKILQTLGTRTDFGEFIELLPSGGESGSTLSRRLKDLGTKVRAKTGTLSTVVALSGFVQDSNGEWIVFSILTNAQKRGSTGAMRDLCDELVRTLSRAKL